MISNYVLRAVMRLILLFLGRLRVFGAENIPATGPYILVVNHMSLADSPVVLLATPPMRLRFFAGEKWASHPIIGPMLRMVGAIFIDRHNVDRRSVQTAVDAIRAGSIFALAPEGSRSHDGQIHRAKDGAAYLGTRAEVPFLPIGVVNTDVLFANARRGKRTTLEAHIGRPFLLPHIGRRVRQRDLPAFTHYIMIHIAALLPPRYHGAYAGSPALYALLRGDDPWPFCLAAEGLAP